ncbi:MAG: ORF6N domain-containing protein [Candidatus Tectomicrobia bacterium]|uniref:ORF6N domain-containing protein n=1 Tax=Tectimicrobiota bacterium TaxID=2528274 RepID=A0A932GPN4_UNCTE|nr:ORF6N domain-containing protein [Candidatus Tectomicrobia bacterium]
MTTLVPTERIDHAILLIRGQKVMLDADLAELYGVTTKVLNQAVNRNRDRFPEDFIFQLTADEKAKVVAKSPHLQCLKFSSVLPCAFTEPGAGMLASVLRSPAATKISIEVLRAFARLRQEEEPEPLPENSGARNLFAAIRDAILLQPEDEIYTTSEPYTYFVQAGDRGPIKIGSTRNLLVRLRTLCAMSPVPLKLLGVMKGDAEDRCHLRLGAFRLHGEWFAPSSVVFDFIREHAVIPESGRA